MELGGKVTIECEKTGYRVELEFKLKVRFTLAVVKEIDAMIGVVLLNVRNKDATYYVNHIECMSFFLHVE